MRSTRVVRRGRRRRRSARRRACGSSAPCRRRAARRRRRGRGRRRGRRAACAAARRSARPASGLGFRRLLPSPLRVGCWPPGQMDAKTESEMTSQTLSPPELNTLTIEIDGDIGTLTLDRPDAFNAMSPEMIRELTVAFAWLADRAPLRALIVTGAGQAFCAGGDVNWFQKGVEDEEIDLPSEVRRGAEALHEAIVDLRRIPYPVIAAVNGPAAGAGFSLALACDIRIASESRLLRLRLRPHRRLAGRRHDLLPAAGGRARPGAGAAARGSQHERRRSARGGPRRRGRGAGGADGRGPREGRGAGRQGAPLRADGEAALRRRASRTASPSTCSWSATGSPTAWPPRTCATASTAFFGGEHPEFQRPLNRGGRRGRIRLQSRDVQPVLRGKDRHEEALQSHSSSSSPRSRSSPAAAGDDSSSSDDGRRRERRRGRAKRAANEAEGGTAGSGGDRRLRSRSRRRPRLHQRQRQRQSRQGDDRLQQPAAAHPRRRDRRLGRRDVGKTELIAEGSDSDRRRPQTRRIHLLLLGARPPRSAAWKAR